MQTRFDVVAVGHAIVDVLAHVDDAFLTSHGIAKGAMTLIDAFRAQTLEEVASGGELPVLGAGFTQRALLVPGNRARRSQQQQPQQPNTACGNHQHILQD